jgi:hypothetical protein
MVGSKKRLAEVREDLVLPPKGPLAGIERLARALQAVPTPERPVLEIVAVSAFAAGAYTRDVVPCFVFGAVLILIHIAWTEWKRFIHGRFPE